jgi:hypothetical protein
MINEKLNLWYCDTFVSQPWQFFFLIVPLIGAYFYGQNKKKIAWILFGIWIPVTILFSAMTNFVFNCNLQG